MESTVYCVKSAEKCQKKCRKQQNPENRGFFRKSRVWAKIAKFAASVESRFPGGTVYVTW